MSILSALYMIASIDEAKERMKVPDLPGSRCCSGVREKEEDDEQ